MSEQEISEDEIVLKLFEQLKKQPRKEQLYFVNLKENQLSSYHFSLGMYIRNQYHLWDRSWEPELVDGVDHSPNHPDAISMRIVTKLWALAKDELKNA